MKSADNTQLTLEELAFLLKASVTNKAGGVTSGSYNGYEFRLLELREGTCVWIKSTLNGAIANTVDAAFLSFAASNYKAFTTIRGYMQEKVFALKVYAAERVWKDDGYGVKVSRCFFRPWLFNLSRLARYDNERLTKLSGATLDQCLLFIRLNTNASSKYL